MVRDKWTRGSSTVERLQDRRFDFEITFFVQKLSYGSENHGPFCQNVPYRWVHHKVDVPLPVAELFVGERIEDYFVPGFVRQFFYDRKRTQRFRTVSIPAHERILSPFLNINPFTPIIAPIARRRNAS